MQDLTGVQRRRLEAKLRRRANRQGLIIFKSRSRNPDCPRFGTFTVVDSNNRLIVGGDAYNGLDLEELVAFLNVSTT
jgi:hypothetical protein